MISQKGIDYIKLSLRQGKTKEVIYKELLGIGWGVDSINEIFDLIFRERLKKDDKDAMRKKVIRIVAVIGALLIGAGFFSFIAANWEGMPKFLKILIIIGSMLAADCAGWVLKEKGANPKTSEALFLLGSIIYGGGIFLVAQMFNISQNWPDGFIVWMIGIIAMAFAIDSFYLFYLAILVSLGVVTGQAFNIFADVFDPNNFLLASSFLLTLAIAVAFAAARLLRNRLPEELREVF